MLYPVLNNFFNWAELGILEFNVTITDIDLWSTGTFLVQQWWEIDLDIPTYTPPPKYIKSEDQITAQ